MGEKKNGLLFFPRWVELFIKIDRDNLSVLSKETDTTYSHVSKTAKQLKNAGYVMIEKKGRTCIVTYTEKGKKLRDLLIEIKGLM